MLTHQKGKNQRIFWIEARKAFEKNPIPFLIKKQTGQKHKQQQQKPEQRNYSRELAHPNKGLVGKAYLILLLRNQMFSS